MGAKLGMSERVLKLWKKTHSCHVGIDSHIILTVAKAMWSVLLHQYFSSFQPLRKVGTVTATPEKT
jgi:hypothetical protein